MLIKDVTDSNIDDDLDSISSDEVSADCEYM